jgi:hypothetical protein
MKYSGAPICPPFEATWRPSNFQTPCEQREIGLVEKQHRRNAFSVRASIASAEPVKSSP